VPHKPCCSGVFQENRVYGALDLNRTLAEHHGSVFTDPAIEYKNEISFFKVTIQTFCVKNIFSKCFVLFGFYFEKFSKKND
jgi:hypothetical protein